MFLVFKGLPCGGELIVLQVTKKVEQSSPNMAAWQNRTSFSMRKNFLTVIQILGWDGQWIRIL